MSELTQLQAQMETEKEEISAEKLPLPELTELIQMEKDTPLPIVNETVVAAAEVESELLSASVLEHDTISASTTENVPLPIEETVSTPKEKESKTTDSENLDELNSLEREIAEMHHVEAGGTSSADQIEIDEMPEEQSESGLIDTQPPSHSATPTSLMEINSPQGNAAVNDTAGNCTAIETDTLGHEDLIAVLKGIDHTQEECSTTSAVESEQAENVTIEGEGQFQIMDVIDDEGDDSALLTNMPVTTSPTKTLPLAKLTREEERAVAMEQMAVLNTRGPTKQNASIQRRRKQDIKPLQMASPDLVSSLGADWSDDDMGVEQSGTSNSIVTVAALAATTDKKSTPIVTNIAAPAEKIPPPKVTRVATATVDTQKSRNTTAKVTSVVVLQGAGTSNTKSKTATNSKVSGTAEDNKDKKSDVAVVTTVPTQTTGFKRTRIIKRKIIWDPDAPETTFSYAQLVRSSSSVASKAKPDANTASTNTVTASNLVAKKEPPAKKVRPVTPKDKKLIAETAEKKPPRSGTPAKVALVAGKASVTQQQSTKSSMVDDTPTRTAEAAASSPTKRRSQTPVANGAGATICKKKKVSEIDRLMGDEGAVNMLNSLENERGKIDASDQSNLDKPHKPLMRSRAATICEKFPKRDTTPITAKRSQTPTISASAATTPTTKNKRGPKPKASASWDYVYKQQASDDSMIIRRRSNSSYSSSASQHRLSIDSPAVTPKVTNAKSASANTTPASNNTASKSALKSTPKTPNTPSSSSITGASSAGSAKQNSPKFEFAKPESKSNQKPNRRTKSPSQSTTNPLTSDMKKATTPLQGRRNIRSPATVDDKEKNAKLSTIGKDASKDEHATTSTVSTSSSDVVVKKAAKVAQIIFNTHKAKLDYTFTAQMMNKLVDILDKLRNDVDCNAVVMVTNAPHFCQGIDFTDLTVGNIEKRKTSALQLATAVKNYLKALATFPKPLIAGVNGSNVGLGVTQLPLFDIVIASDKGSYETPYAKYGQVPEGFCIWNLSTKIRSNFKTKLFWLCEKLHSTESALSGLVNKLTAPSKVNEDALLAAKKIAALSAESYRIMKQTTINSTLDEIVEGLDDEFSTIAEQWTSTECYENFKKYLETRYS